MTPATRQFYTRYHLLAAILPAYLQGLLLAGLLFLQHGLAAGLSREGGWVITGVWALTCLAGFELFSRMGFVISGTPARRVTPEPDEETLLADALAPHPGAALELKPALVELGEVPLLAAGGYTPDQLWISTHTLHGTPAASLRLLVAHERAHVQAGDLSRFLLAAAFWGLSWPIAQIAQGNLLWLLAVAFVQGALWLHLRQIMNARAERTADLRAAQTADVELYAKVLAVHLAEFEPPGSTSLRESRLRGLGLDQAAIQRLLDSTG
jgi:hypothetical protein